jgi:flagellar protein FlaG
MSGLGDFGIRLSPVQRNESVGTGAKHAYASHGNGISSPGDQERADAVQPVTQSDHQRNTDNENNDRMAENLAGEVKENLSSVTSLRFKVDEDLGKVVIRVVDRQSDKVIRQIPTDDMLELTKRMHDMRGLLFDKEA